MAAKTPRSLTGVTPNILDKMDDYIDNMAKSITNKKAVLDKLVANNYKQSSNISMKANNIPTLSDESKKRQLRIINRGSRGGRGGKSDDARKFPKDGYCWSHGYKVLHMSSDYRNNEEGHRDISIRSNTMKGITFNIGRD